MSCALLSHLFRRLFITGAVTFSAVSAIAGKYTDQYEAQQPVVHYRLKVDTLDLSGYAIEMQLHHVPHHFQLAMATHHEYDDRFWRFVKDFHVETAKGVAVFAKTDSAVWDITVPENDAVVSYKIQLPGGNRFAHRPFIAFYGGLLGDIHSFFYLVGQMQIPYTVTFDLPNGWQIASGLESTADSHTFTASSAKTLMDCPVSVGRLLRWDFRVRGISHTIAYLPIPGGPAFDTALLVTNIQKIALQTINLFGNAPYKHYTFLLEDGVRGALEHANSVTIGAPASLLASRMEEIYEQIAHEFIHTWNLMSIRPAGYSDLNYRPQERSEGLWFSEGITMFYADLLVRRAGLPCEDSSRMIHLQSLIGQYYRDTGNMVFPPATVSLASNEAPGRLGDYSASVHLQGELLGAMLDLLIRKATEGARSLDDVMRLMYERFGGKEEFDAKAIEQVVRDVCGNDTAHSFFQKYIYQGKALDFNRYLPFIGLQLQLSYQSATNDKGYPAEDARLYVWQPIGDTMYHLVMTHPGSCWVRAGLHTGDGLVTINGHPIKSRQSFYSLLSELRIGDKLVVHVERSGGSQTIPVDVTGYEIPVAHLINRENKGIGAQRLFQQWEEGR